MNRVGGDEEIKWSKIPYCLSGVYIPTHLGRGTPCIIIDSDEQASQSVSNRWFIRSLGGRWRLPTESDAALPMNDKARNVYRSP